MSNPIKSFSPELRTLVEAFIVARNKFIANGKTSGELKLEINLLSEFKPDAIPRMSMKGICYYYGQKNAFIEAHGVETEELFSEVFRQLERDNRLILLSAPVETDTNSEG